MLTFKNFLLTEKVSKKQIDQALRNDNIYVGVEFEFVVDPEYQVSGDLEDSYEKAQSAWDEYQEDLRIIIRDIESSGAHLEALADEAFQIASDFADEVESEHNSRLPYEYSINTNSIDRPYHSDDFEDELIKPLEILKRELKTNLDSTRKRIDGFHQQSFDFMKKEKEKFSLEDLKFAVKVLESNLKDVDGHITKIKDLADEFQIEYSEDLHSSLYNLKNLEPNLDYYDYFDLIAMDVTYGAEEETVEGIFGEFEYQVYPEPFRPEPDYYEDLDLPDSDIEKTAENIVAEAPFDDYVAGGYHSSSKQRPGDTTWRMEEDSSLPKGGIEVISPPIKLPEFVKLLPKIFKWIDKVGSTTDRCGLHVHISHKDHQGDLESKINLIKLILLNDEEYVYQSMPTRKDNHYAQSMKVATNSSGNVILSKEALIELLGKKKLNDRISRHHFAGINISGIGDGHIEFRFMGGSNYHKKESEVKKIIANFAHNFSAALDDEYMNKEFLTKLVRLQNKIEGDVEVYSDLSFFSALGYAFRRSEKTLRLRDLLSKKDVNTALKKKRLTPMLPITKGEMTGLYNYFNTDNIQVILDATLDQIMKSGATSISTMGLLVAESYMITPLLESLKNKHGASHEMAARGQIVKAYMEKRPNKSYTINKSYKHLYMSLYREVFKRQKDRATKPFMSVLKNMIG